jgi:hypothetical protein
MHDFRVPHPILVFRIYMALLIGFGFAALVFLVTMSLGSNLAFGMIGIALLMPGIALVGACCKSPVPAVVANGLIYSAVAFIFVWLGTRGLQEKALRRFLRPVTLIVVGTVALGWGTARALEWAWEAPSDEAIVKLFDQHHSELETLVSMAHEDRSIGRIANDFLSPQNPDASSASLPEARWNDYRALFRKIGLSAGLQKDSDENIYFIVHTEGTVVSGGSKGLVYCEKAQGSPSDFLACTEEHDSGKAEDARGRGSQYRHVTEHWFVYSYWD